MNYESICKKYKAAFPKRNAVVCKHCKKKGGTPIGLFRSPFGKTIHLLADYQDYQMWDPKSPSIKVSKVVSACGYSNTYMLNKEIIYL